MKKFCCLPGIVALLSLSFYAAAQQQAAFADSILISGFTPFEFSLSNQYISQTDTQFSREAGLTGLASVNSNAVNMPFTFALLGNRFIDDDTKDGVNKRLHAHNAYEFRYEFGGYVNWRSDHFIPHHPTQFTIDFSSGNFSVARFTDAAFNTIFYGNNYYAGAMADFSGTRFYGFSYQRIGCGMQQELPAKNGGTWLLGGKLSLLTVHDAMMLNMPTATLFTEQYGQYLDADYEFTLNESDATNSGFLQADGWGAQLDAQAAYANKAHNSRFTLTINSLGFTSWDQHTRAFTADSTIHFEGLDINNLFSHDSSLISYNRDSLFSNTGTTETTGARSFLLPLQFSFSFTRVIGRQLLLYSGIAYRPVADLLPMIFVKPQWQITRSFQLGIPLSYGGASRYAAGADAQFILFRQLKLIAGIDNVLAIALPQQTTSAALFLQAAIQF